MLGAGIWNGRQGVRPPGLPGSYDSYFDDFITGLTASGQPVGQLGWGSAVNNGGYIGDMTSGNPSPTVAGRLGLIALGTGTTNNVTGQAFLNLTAVQTYPGNGAMAFYWAFQMPAVLSGTPAYAIEMGLGVSPFSQSAPAVVLQYYPPSSTNFSAYTNDNAVTNLITNAAAAFTPVVNGWYTAGIIMPANGLSASFYIAPAGSPLALLGTSNANLPSLAHQICPFFNIYKTGNSSATNRIMTIDWWKMDVQGLVHV